MTEQDAKSAAAAEPSMEDILASIRRILAEDGATAAAANESAAGEPPAPSARPAVGRRAGDATVAREIPPAASSVALDRAFTRTVGAKPASPRHDIFRPPFDEEDVFVLTPEMRIEVAAGSIGGERIVSNRTATNGTDVLAQLASAILDRRDIAVSTRDVTLEGMVREMLRPLLREWLDRNLPYLIERLVKREIDLMINRAERLED